MRNIPSTFHLSVLWTAVAALSIVVTVAIAVGVIYLGTQIIAFLQPILIPFAVAGVLAYLLEPLVIRLVQWGIKRQRAVLMVFSAASLMFGGVLLLMLPTLLRQGSEFAKEAPGYAEKTQTQVLDWVNKWHSRLKNDYHIEVLDFLAAAQKKEEPAPAVGAAPVAKPVAVPVAKPVDDTFDPHNPLDGEWIKEALTSIAPATWALIKRSLGGFLGVFGFLLSLVLVPVYLFYFLLEKDGIVRAWTDYLPIHESRIKEELVFVLQAINDCLIAFFRGQLVVSLINGVATGCGLVFVGLKFGWLIGLSLCVLGMIPYLGIILCMIPAVLIASVQGGSWLIPVTWPGWAFPLIVLTIFITVQQIDGWFVTPKIVGESVGLHPMTVIMSVFLWSLVMGGLLGAILAVPITASVKVLFQRYVWNARFRTGEGETLIESS